MSTGVMITLIICITIILLFGTIMIAAVVLNKQNMIAAVALNKQKKQDQVDHHQRNDFPTIEDFQKKDGKY